MKKTPVALWKGIVGTSVSGFLLLSTSLLFLILYFLKVPLPIYTIVLFVVAIVIEIISLIISIINLYETTIYKQQLKKIETKSSKVEGDKKAEILHRLLAENKITIEEYDELNK